MNANPIAQQIGQVLLWVSAEVRQQLDPVLTQINLACEAIDDIDGFCEAIRTRGDAGIILMELLTPPAMKHLVDVLRQQESWSDFPLIALCQAAQDSFGHGLRMMELLEPLGNFTILHRPISALCLASAIQNCLRARRVQYHLRDRLRQWDGLVRQRERFLDRLAHEVRNPLSSMRNAAEILKGLAPTIPEILEQQSLIARQTSRLAVLIDEVLSVSQLQSQRMHLRHEPIDLGQLVHRAADVTAQEVAAKRLQLRISDADSSVIVDGDPERLLLMLTDLLLRAIRHSAMNEKIELQVSREQESAFIRIRDFHADNFEDSSDQIPALIIEGETAELDAQVHTAPSMPLVEGLVKRHRGRVVVQPLTDPIGCKVTVQLPISCRAKRDFGSRPSIGATGRRILIVEDNDDGRESLQTLLQLWGHTVETAADGPTGVSKAVIFEPEIALVDIGLPKMDGYEVVRSIRKIRRGSPYLIAMTGYGESHHRQSALDAGFDQFVVKPLDPIQLRELLEASSKAQSTGSQAIIG